LMENKAPLQKKHNFVKGSTWLKCSNMCVAHILANPPIYYVKLNMNNRQWKLEGIRTWQPKWHNCKTTKHQRESSRLWQDQCRVVMKQY
jgi:hypothetical protein